MLCVSLDYKLLLLCAGNSKRIVPSFNCFDVAVRSLAILDTAIVVVLLHNLKLLLHLGAGSHYD